MGRNRLNKAFDSRVKKLTVNVTDADLTAAATTQTLPIGALPAGAQILGYRIGLTTPFTGGTASAVTVDIGDAGDVDAIADGCDVFAAAVDGEASALTDGIAPNKLFAASTTLNMVVNSTGDDVDNLTAGDMDVEVIYGIADISD
jgi:hypothetical protein